MKRVPVDYATVDAAVNAASANEEIWIANGDRVLTSPLVIGAKGIQLVGESVTGTRLSCQNFSDWNQPFIDHAHPSMPGDALLRIANLSLVSIGPLNAPMIKLWRPWQASCASRHLVMEHVRIERQDTHSFLRAVEYENCWLLLVRDVTVRNKPATMDRGFLGKGKSVTAKFEDVIVYDADKAPTGGDPSTGGVGFRVVGSDIEGHVWRDCSVPNGYRGWSLDLDIIGGVVRPGFILDNPHADVENTAIYASNISQFKIKGGNLYRRNAATGAYDAIALVNTVQEAVIAQTNFVNTAGNDGGAREGGSGVWGVVAYGSGVQDYEVDGVTGRGFYDTVRLRAGTRRFRVHDCGEISPASGGKAVRNLSGYTSAPDALLHDNQSEA